MDIINAAAFSFDDSMNTTKHQIAYLQNREEAGVTSGKDNSVDFPTAPEIPDVAAFYGVIEHLGTQFQAIMPRLEHKIRLWSQPELRRNIARKDEIIAREISKTLARFEKGDHTLHSALDHLLHRESNAAKKADREPVFDSPRINDEVWEFHLLLFIGFLAFINLSQLDLWIHHWWPRNNLGRTAM